AADAASRLPHRRLAGEHADAADGLLPVHRHRRATVPPGRRHRLGHLPDNPVCARPGRRVDRAVRRLVPVGRPLGPRLPGRPLGDLVSEQTIILLILVGAVAAFVWNRLPVGIVALGVMLSLWVTGVVTLAEALSGFASPTVVLIAALFVVAEGLDAAGLTAWVGQAVVRYAGASRVRLVLLTMAAVAVLSALITPNGAVAALYPLVVVLAVRFAKSPSRLLMRAAFAAHAGALLVLTGSPVTLLVSAASDGAGAGRFGFFEVALVGLPLLLGTMLVTLLLGNRLLPERKPRAFSRDLTALPATLRRQYIAEDELARLTVGTDSPLVGSLPGKLVGPDYPDVHVISVRDRSGAPLGDEPVAEGARLLVRGDREEIRRFALDNWLVLTGDADAAPESSLIDKEFGVAEVIVSPRSNYIGDDVF